MPTVFAYTIDIIWSQSERKDLLRYFPLIAVSPRSVCTYKICIGRAHGERELEESREGVCVQTVCINHPLSAHRKCAHTRSLILSIGILIWEKISFIKYFATPNANFYCGKFFNSRAEESLNSQCRDVWLCVMLRQR